MLGPQYGVANLERELLAEAGEGPRLKKGDRVSTPAGYGTVMGRVGTTLGPVKDGRVGVVLDKKKRQRGYRGDIFPVSRVKPLTEDRMTDEQAASRFIMRKYHVTKKELAGHSSREIEAADRATEAWRRKNTGAAAGSPLSRGYFLDRLRGKAGDPPRSKHPLHRAVAGWRKPGERVSTSMGPGKVDRMVTVIKGSAKRLGVVVKLDSGKKATLPAKQVRPISESRLAEALPSATVEMFQMVMVSYLTQYDQKETAREMKRGGRGNIYRLGHLLAAAEKVESDTKRYKKQDSKEALGAFVASVGKRFHADYPPIKKTLKAVDVYLTKGKKPTLVMGGRSRQQEDRMIDLLSEKGMPPEVLAKFKAKKNGDGDDGGKKGKLPAALKKHQFKPKGGKAEENLDERISYGGNLPGGASRAMLLHALRKKKEDEEKKKKAKKVGGHSKQVPMGKREEMELLRELERLETTSSPFPEVREARIEAVRAELEKLQG